MLINLKYRQKTPDFLVFFDFLWCLHYFDLLSQCYLGIVRKIANLQSMKTVVLPQVPFLDFWSSLQVGYSQIVRWKGYVEANPMLRAQTNSEHVASVLLLFEYFLNFECLNHRLVQDVDGHNNQRRQDEIIKMAINLHEIGEIKNDDTLYHDKSNDKHIAEIKSFILFFDSMPELGVNRRLLIKAFLLQFTTSDSIDFSVLGSEIQNTFESVKSELSFEGKIFNALERFDYFLYAFESYQNHKDVVILKHVLVNQKHHLDQYVKEIEGLEKLWTPEIQTFACDFLEDYSSIPGPKEEGGISRAYAFARQQGWM